MPKNIILFIGDGMGPQQVGLLELYARKAPSKPFGDRPTSFARMSETGVLGMSLHDPHEFLVTDSACSATQLSLGVPAPVEAIGVDQHGNPMETVLEKAKRLGKRTGLVSDTRITHATPASFAAHVHHRNEENIIAEQMLQTAPDVMLSGGRRHFLPHDVDGSRRTDSRDLLKEATDAGYTVVGTRAELAAADDGPLLGLFAHSGMLNAIADHRTREAPDRTEPTLAEMSIAAIERLSADEDGFFLMVESGQIDWAGHGNDAGWLLHEMVRANETLDHILDWAETRDDTLVIVTADHETGGFGVGYSRTRQIAPRTLPGSAFEDAPFAPNTNYVEASTLDAIYRQTHTWGDLLTDFSTRPETEQTPAALAKRLTDAGGFVVTEDAAARILASIPDPFSDAEEPERISHFHDFAAFYPTAEYGRTGLVARELAEQQNMVWATGGHTHTPVMVFGVGTGSQHLLGLHHHTQIGQLMHQLVSGSAPD